MTGNQRLQQLIGHFQATIGKIRDRKCKVTKADIDDITVDDAEAIFTEALNENYVHDNDWPAITGPVSADDDTVIIEQPATTPAAAETEAA